MRISVNVRSTARPASSWPAQDHDFATSAADSAFEVESHGPQRSPSTRLLAGLALLAMCVALLWIDFGFARYAFTGFQWIEANGTVLDAHTTSSPTIQFVAPDGTAHTFTENYFRICGRRSLCMYRDFTPGQAVPIVYDPSAPAHAYVQDWALYSNVIMWFVEAGVALLVVLMLVVVVRRKPLSFSVGTTSRPTQL